MNNGKLSFWYSWPAIIIAFWLFWPVGLYLLIKRFSSDKKAALSAGGKSMKVVGIILIVFAAFGYLGLLSDFISGSSINQNASGLIFLSFIAVGGVVLLRKAKKMKAEAESIKQYLSIIVNGNVLQLDAIAATTGKSYDVVHKDIKNMIDKGFLKNAYINEGSREVVLPSAAPASQNTVNATTTAAPAQTKIVTCPCCGANNTIHGETGECEYCGSPLK